MSALMLPINTVADAHRAIHVLQQTGFEFRIPLIRSVIDGRIAHLEVQRTGSSRRLKIFLRLTVRRPTLILIGDDDDEPTGPAGWPVAQRLLRWARAVVLHATGGQREHYEAAIDLAEACGSVLVVECSSAMLPAWWAATKRWAPDVPVQLFVPNTDMAHPVPTAPGSVQ